MMKEGARQRALRAIERFKRSVEPRHKIIRALAGDGAGNVEVTGFANVYWVRILGRDAHLARAYCRTMIPTHDMNVLCRVTAKDNRFQYVIVGVPDTQGDFTNEDGYGVGSLAPPHSHAHEWLGADAVSVAKFLIEPLRALPTDPVSMQLEVTWDNAVAFDDTLIAPDTQTSPAFTAPTFGQRYDLLVMDSSGTLEIVEGVADVVDPSYPDFPPGKMPICYVLLGSADTSVEVSSIYDCRPVFSMSTVSETSEGIHVHVFHEDKSLECDGAKLLFHPANQFEFETIQIFYNGLHLTLNEDFSEGAFYDEVLLTPGSALLAAAPILGDKLIFMYLVER